MRVNTVKLVLARCLLLRGSEVVRPRMRKQLGAEQRRGSAQVVLQRATRAAIFDTFLFETGRWLQIWNTGLFYFDTAKLITCIILEHSFRASLVIVLAVSP